MARPLHTMIVLGTRPEVTKLGPVALELRRHPKHFRVSLVGTGQHRELVPQQLKMFGLRLHHDLKVMKHRQTLADITSRTADRMHSLLARARPEVVIVEGDTTAVLAAGLTAFYHQIPVAHVEAGLRSGDPYNPFPEEMNRRLVGGLAQIHFAPTAQARANLLRENVPADNIYVTGNTAVDALFHALRKRPRRAALPAGVLRNRRLILVTAHRRESWGEGIRQICLALRDLASAFEEVVIAYAVHPNPLVRGTAEKVLAGQDRVHLIDPPDYVTFVDLMRRAYLIITDSGGIQEEAPSLAKPVLVTRHTTERVEGVAAGGAELVGPDRGRIAARASRLLNDPAAYADMARVRNPYGDGKAAARIRRALGYHFRLTRRRPADFEVP